MPCTWPEQRKRGPAKGYIEGLEHRLHEAESLLLQILPHVSAEQLQTATTALASHDEDSDRHSPDRRSSPPILNKKTGIDYWDTFPLTSAESIKLWQQDCEGQSARSKSNSAKPEQRKASPHVQQGEKSTSKRKRTSVMEHKPSVTYSEDAMALDALYTLSNDQSTSAQAVQAHNVENEMAMNRQQQANWQTSTMNMNSTQPPPQQKLGISQQQTFPSLDYMNTSKPQRWEHLGVQVDVSSTGTNSQDRTQALTAQTQSHLFW